MSQHTPGPWRIRAERYKFIRIETALSGIAGLDTIDGEGMANARLIAAAPDLLAALEAMVAVHDKPCRFDHNGYCQSHYLDHQVDGCLVQIARDAIKKARGE